MDEEIEEAMNLLRRRVLCRENLSLSEIKELAELGEELSYCIKESVGNLGES